MLWVWSLIGCTVIELPSQTPDCDPRILTETEVRIRPLLCGDEEIPSGDGRRGDLILENNQIRLTLRPPGTSLSQVSGFGGTIVDIVPVIEQADGDLLMELWLSGPNANATTILGWTIRDDLRGIVLHSDIGNTEIWLEPNQPTVYFSPDTWTLRPTLDAELYGHQLYPASDTHKHSLSFKAIEINDLGGDIVLHELTSMNVRLSSNQGSKTLTLPAEALSNIDWVDTYDANDNWLGRIHVSDVTEQLYLSEQTVAIEVGKQGCRTLGPQDIEQPIDWTPDTCGSIGLRLFDDIDEIDGWFKIDTETHYIPTSGLILPLIDHDDVIQIWSGLNHATYTLDLSTLSLSEHPRLNLYLPQAFSNSRALHTQVNTAPSHTARSIKPLLHQSIGLHATDYLLAAPDSILRLMNTEAPLQIWNPERLQRGVLSGQTVLSWPWTSNLQAGFGAIDPTFLTEADLLAQATGQNRLTATTSDFLTADTSLEPQWALPDFRWMPSPTISDLRDVCTWDHPRPFGPWTWIDLPDADVNYALLEFMYSTGNGPRLILNTQFSTPRQTTLSFNIASTDWMNLEYWEVWSERGLENTGQIDQPTLSHQGMYPTRERWCLITWGSPSIHPFQDDLSWAVRILEPMP